MPTYIAIDHTTGYIYGVATTSTPEAACRAIADMHHTFHQVPHAIAGDWRVYAAHESFPVIVDGADQETIDCVEAACVHVGNYRRD